MAPVHGAHDGHGHGTVFVSPLFIVTAAMFLPATPLVPTAPSSKVTTSPRSRTSTRNRPRSRLPRERRQASGGLEPDIPQHGRQPPGCGKAGLSQENTPLPEFSTLHGRPVVLRQ